MQQKVLSVEELKLLLERYQIGKKPLAALLGWGATTILRYAEGLPPTKEYGLRLRELYEQPQEYLSLLEKNKAVLTPIAYKKSKNAVLSLQCTKLAAGAAYLFSLAEGDISPLYLAASLYYAQAFSFPVNKAPIFSEDCELTESGIPYRVIYEQARLQKSFQSFSYGEIFCKQEKDLLKEVYQALLAISPKELRELLATERTYMKTTRSEQGKKLRNSTIAAFFKKISTVYQISGRKDLSAYFLERTGRRKRKQTKKAPPL